MQEENLTVNAVAIEACKGKWVGLCTPSSATHWLPGGANFGRVRFLGLRTIPSEGCSCELSAVIFTAAGEGYALQRRDLGEEGIIHLSITMWCQNWDRTIHTNSQPIFSCNIIC